MRKVDNTAASIANSAPAKVSQKAFSMGVDNLNKLSQHLMGDKNTAALGEALQNAIAKKNDIGQKAILFKLMQDPNTRNMLRDFTFGEQQ